MSRLTLPKHLRDQYANGYGKATTAQINAWHNKLAQIEDAEEATEVQQNSVTSTKPTYVQVTQLLRDIGIPASIKGYAFIREAIMLCEEDRGVLDSVTKDLYPKVANKCETTPSRVERAIRHAIHVAYSRGDINAIAKVCGKALSVRGKLTNSEFIAALVDYMGMERMM